MLHNNSMGRPKLPYLKRKSVFITLRVTPEELTRVKFNIKKILEEERRMR